jgi:protein-arginine kinase activator protein McsA
MGDTTDELIAGTTTGGDGSRRLIAKKGGRKDGDWAQRLNLGAGSWASASESDKISIQKSNFQLENSNEQAPLSALSESERSELLNELRAEMETAAKSLDFEQAARLRDRIYEIEHMSE